MNGVQSNSRQLNDVSKLLRSLKEADDSASDDDESRAGVSEDETVSIYSGEQHAFVRKNIASIYSCLF